MFGCVTTTSQEKKRVSNLAARYLKAAGLLVEQRAFSLINRGRGSAGDVSALYRAAWLARPIGSMSVPATNCHKKAYQSHANEVFAAQPCLERVAVVHELPWHPQFAGPC